MPIVTRLVLAVGIVQACENFGGIFLLAGSEAECNSGEYVRIDGSHCGGSN